MDRVHAPMVAVTAGVVPPTVYEILKTDGGLLACVTWGQSCAKNRRGARVGDAGPARVASVTFTYHLIVWTQLRRGQYCGDCCIDGPQRDLDAAFPEARGAD